MDIKTIMLLILALAPAIALLIFIYKKDRVEKEPIGLLLLLFFLGAISTIPAGNIENLLIGAMQGIASNFARKTSDGSLVFSTWIGLAIYQFFKYFIGVALVEEGLKWIILFFVTRKNKNFNCYFDGIVYAVVVSLGFAAIENIDYVLTLGVVTGIKRALLSVPGHMFFAVFMGMFYSKWHEEKKMYEFEKRLSIKGIVSGNPMRKKRLTLFFSILVPVAIHGFYDFAISLSSSIFWTIVFYAFIVILYFMAFGYISIKSKADEFDELYSVGLVVNEYPGLVTYMDTPDEEITDPDIALIKKYLIRIRRGEYKDQVSEIGNITKNEI